MSLTLARLRAVGHEPYSDASCQRQLAQQGKKVLLIDADAQANLTMSFGCHRPDDIPVTLSTIMQDIINDKSVDVSRSILHPVEGVDLFETDQSREEAALRKIRDGN